jgi:hypothetical protein
MKHNPLRLVFAISFAVNLLITGPVSAYTFVPANSSDTDSGYLVDNYSVLINGSQINPNYNFESGTFDGFIHLPGTLVIDRLGNILPPGGTGYFAFASTGPGAIPGGGFEHQNIMQQFSVTGPVTSAIVSLQLMIFTNQDPPTASDPDWFHYLIWPKSSPTGPFIPPPYNIFYQEIQDFSFVPADPTTGFKWQTPEFVSLQRNVTGDINGFVSQNILDFEVHAVIAERLRAPEPSTFALLGLGLAGLAASRRRKG